MWGKNVRFSYFPAAGILFSGASLVRERCSGAPGGWSGGDGDVIEDAEPHPAARGGVVSRRARGHRTPEGTLLPTPLRERKGK